MWEEPPKSGEFYHEIELTHQEWRVFTKLSLVSLTPIDNVLSKRAHPNEIGNDLGTSKNHFNHFPQNHPTKNGKNVPLHPFIQVILSTNHGDLQKWSAAKNVLLRVCIKFTPKINRSKSLQPTILSISWPSLTLLDLPIWTIHPQSSRSCQWHPPHWGTPKGVQIQPGFSATTWRMNGSTTLPSNVRCETPGWLAHPVGFFPIF